MSVTHSRRLAGAAGAAFLVVAVAGCSGLGRNAAGTLAYETADERHVSVSNPLVTGCHRLDAPGAVSVTNNTLVDLVLYPTQDCTGEDTIYLPTTVSDIIAPGARPWQSYTIVH
ncbi:MULTISPECIES: hypothetical protein [unclassified Streptomyces]|uniref:hypothetical protein n=1 Tax=unclassified Streptomyces TaxID=2593676 RepID=UPI0028C390E4|nr:MULTISPECIES: hypothetical protein [unclassified Streptomyces]WNO74460.1 hypothetical protein RPQ07_23880 [Streptomyces sp. AM8-1-1]